MNPYRDERQFDDALGQALRWSLHAGAVGAEPSPETWANIEKRVKCGRHSRAHGIRRAFRRSLAIGQLLRRMWLFVLFRTLASESVWAPDWSGKLRQNDTLQDFMLSNWSSSWFIYGRLKPLF